MRLKTRTYLIKNLDINKTHYPRRKFHKTAEKPRVCQDIWGHFDTSNTDLRFVQYGVIVQIGKDGTRDASGIENTSPFQQLQSQS